MKEIIQRIHKRRTEYSHPEQATTTANALELLSSGIYTEEERFVFELLQNAVDSFDPNISEGLDVKIIVNENQLIFLHNGTPFSERDLEGLCDIGNGNKMSDSKKIGYKGIGFKSVFMHSKKVTVITSNTCFKFDREECEEIAKSKGPSFRDVKMPWQIIPIATELPSEISTDGYNVVTILDISNGKRLLDKINRLLSDARFILFLNVKNLHIRLFEEEREILCLSKTLEGDLLTIAKNNIPLNKWLMHSVEIKLNEYPDVKLELQHDAKTPDKLKNSETIEISFAIALDEENKIIPLKNALIYTYLPTSFSFGFPFIVNANFITDAGRQQLIKDSEWNKFLFSQIPSIYLNWIKDKVAPNHEYWYKVLLPIKNENDELTLSYSSALTTSIEKIPFVRTLKGEQKLISESLFDEYKFFEGVPENSYNELLREKFNLIGGINVIVTNESGIYLTDYKIKKLSKNDINCFIENSLNYLSNWKDADYSTFFSWLMNFESLENSDFIKHLSYSNILPDEDEKLSKPIEMFFPSEFKTNNDIAKDAVVVSSKLVAELTSEQIEWLSKLGVQQMSKLSIIEKVLCVDGYITEENAIDVLKYIFQYDQKEGLWDKISKYKLENLKLLTTGGNLKYASELYLSDIYKPTCKIQKDYYDDIFVSEKYIGKDLDIIIEWSIFLRRLGVSEDIDLQTIKYGTDSWIMKNYIIQNNVSLAKKTEYNTAWDGRRFYLGCAGGLCLKVKSTPFLKPLNEFEKKPTLDFYSKVWSRILSQSKPGSKDDYIYGSTGMGYSAYAYLSERKYLNKIYIEWLIENYSLIPASDANLHRINEILPNSKGNIDIFGKYLPVISINEEIKPEWNDILHFKSEISLGDYLNVLHRISKEEEKADIAVNKDRICRIYDLIADNFDFTEGSSNYNLIRDWGKTNSILSKELEFVVPEKLCLLSNKITGVNIDNQVFHHKTQENSRFAEMMIAMGVNFINDHRVEGIENAFPDNAVKNEIEAKIEFFTAITSGENFTEESWNEALKKMKEAFNKILFFNIDVIKVVYGNHVIIKPVYVKDSNIYYSGKFNLAVKEMLTPDLVRILGLHRNDQTIFLTLLQMKDFDEIIEYLDLKGYDTQFIKRPTFPDINPKVATFGGEDSSLTGLTREHMQAALAEAKDTIISQLSLSGFDVTHYSWDGWTCIDGITKEGIEYPIVIRSNKSGSNTKLSSIDWNQLMKPNAMFVVNTNSGVGTINFRELLRSKDNITIRFSSENIDRPDHIYNLAEVFTYFKGLQFDFESYIKPVIRRWESF